MWAKYEEIQKFTTVNRFSKITDIGSLNVRLKSVFRETDMIVLNINPVLKASRLQNRFQNNCNSFPYLTVRHLAEKPSIPVFSVI